MDWFGAVRADDVAVVEFFDEEEAWVSFPTAAVEGFEASSVAVARVDAAEAFLSLV